MLNASIRAFTRPSAAFGRSAALTLIAAAVLSACGGGGGDPGAVPAASGAGSTGPGTGTVTAPTTPVSETKVSVVMVDGSGNPVTTLSGGDIGRVKVTVLNAAGAPSVGAVVRLTAAAQGPVVFTQPEKATEPYVASAITDASGVAVATVTPASYTANGAGSFSVTATTTDGKTGTGALSIGIGAAPLTVGALSFSTQQTGALPAFSTVALKIPVSSAGKPASVSTGLTLSSLCAGDGTATLTLGAMSGGVQLATYTNNGCTRGSDVITATIGSSSQPITLDVSPANIGVIQFVSSSLNGQSIVRKGSGGLGRSESAQLNFHVVDQQGKGLGGVDVGFSATTTIGGLSVSPAIATTDAAGNVSVTVSSGTIPTPVRVLASATRNGRTISGMSDTLIVSTGLPIQKSMSIRPEYYNVEGGDISGTEVGITARLADQYGNKVSDGSAVTFVTEGGAIATSAQGGCTTVDGACSVKLVSQPYIPANGRITVLAMVQGVENFIDMNGDGEYSCTGYTGAPGTYRPLVDACPSGGEQFEDMGDPYLDTDFDGKYDAGRDLPFPFDGANPNKGKDKWGLNYLRSSIEIVFSGSYARMTEFCAKGVCDTATYRGGAVLTVPGAAGANCAPQLVSVRLTDANNNPLPFDTAVSVVSATKVSVAGVSPATIPSTSSSGGTVHLFTVVPEASCAAGDITLQVATPKGNIREFKFFAN